MKKTIQLLLTSAIIASLISCGGTKKETTGDDASSNQETVLSGSIQEV